MHYLVTEFKYYVDPHGSPDLGGVKKFVTEDARYLDYVHDDDDYYYDGDGDFTHLDDLRGSEDGYNATTHQYSVKELTPEEAEEAIAIIDAYNNL